MPKDIGAAAKFAVRGYHPRAMHAPKRGVPGYTVYYSSLPRPLPWALGRLSEIVSMIMHFFYICFCCISLKFQHTFVIFHSVIENEAAVKMSDKINKLTDMTLR